jgi:hypothetical protein
VISWHYTRPADPPRAHRPSADTPATRIENVERTTYLKAAVEGSINMAANPVRRYTLEEYFELERTSEERFELWDGEVFCMSGGSEAHIEIESNPVAFLKPQLRERGSRAFPAEMRIKQGRRMRAEGR